MEENARIEWDRRYLEGSHRSPTPDPFWSAHMETLLRPVSRSLGAPWISREASAAMLYFSPNADGTSR